MSAMHRATAFLPCRRETNPAAVAEGSIATENGNQIVTDEGVSGAAGSGCSTGRTGRFCLGPVPDIIRSLALLAATDVMIAVRTAYRAGGISARLRGVRKLLGRVLRVCLRLKVFVVGADTVPAEMIQLQPFWHRTDEVLVDGTMHHDRAPFEIAASVMTGALMPRPLPTPGRKRLRLAENESLQEIKDRILLHGCKFSVQPEVS
jgi:hypothetical protein